MFKLKTRQVIPEKFIQIELEVVSHHFFTSGILQLYVSRDLKINK